MEMQARYLMVGSFVLFLLVGILLFVMWIGKTELGSKNKIYDIYFQGSVTGLKVGSQVLFRGVPVGTVGSISIDSKRMEDIHVRVGLLATTPIHVDTLATLEMQGITGIAFIQLKGGSSTSPILECPEGQAYPIIPSKPSKIEEIFDSAPKLLENINTLSQSLNLLFDDANMKNFASILKSMRILTEALEKNSSTLDQIFERANSAFEEVTQTSKSYRVFAETLQKEIIPLSSAAQAFFTEWSSFLEENKGPFNAFLTSSLYEFSTVLSELRRTLESINRLTVNIERDPWTFIFGTGDQGYVLN